MMGHTFAGTTHTFAAHYPYPHERTMLLWVAQQDA